MIQIKEFWETFGECGRYNDLDEQINKFLAETKCEFIDIKYSKDNFKSETLHSGTTIHYILSSALLIFKI